MRTYFDLYPIINNVFFRPLTAYSACMASGLRPTPAEFRTGNRWPYQWGSVAGEFRNRCIYNPTVSSEKIHSDMAASPEVTRVIVWEIVGPGLYALRLGDPAASGLGDAWLVASDERIVTHSYWTWEDEWVLRRREFHRKSMSPGPGGRQAE